ncbi:MAG: hypothetical protein JWM19_4610 [Actinomycetia bacterium]|nr:hypothetical protein [Actinomycetes bacterium]
MLRASLGTTLVLLGVLGATAAGSLTANASPADAPADTFTVVSAGASASNPDQLSVVVDSSSTIAGLTAQFLANNTDAYDQALTPGSTVGDPADPSQTQSTWTANIPAGTGGLPLGDYSITLNGTFTDSTSATYSQSDAGTFSFLATSAVTLQAASTELSYPTTTAGLSGAVTLTNPDGTADTDYTGVSVNIVGGGDSDLVSVASDGTFSVPDFSPPASETVVAQTVGNLIQGSQSASISLTVTNTTPTLTLKSKTVSESYGKAVAMTGTLTYKSGSTSEPASGQEVWIGLQTWDWSSPLATTKTAANGTFSITVPAEQTATTLYVGTTNQNYLTEVVTPLQVDVVNPTVVSSFRVSLNQYWGLSVSGCLGFASGNRAQRLSHTSGLTVQYASSAAGPWRNLFRINPNEPDTSCGTGGIKFTGSSTAPENYAYYRVAYAGTTGATSYAATDSNAVLAWRYADRITGLKVSPTVVNAGGKLTITGTLQYYYTTWHNYSGQTIVIDLRPQGSSTWYWLVKVKTNSKGQFIATFKDPVSATWEAVFDGNNNNGVGHLFYGSSQVYVRLK